MLYSVHVVLSFFGLFCVVVYYVRRRNLYGLTNPKAHGPTVTRTCHLRDSPTISEPSTFRHAHFRNMATVSEAGLVETFDLLASEDVIVYGPHETVKVEDNGYPVRRPSDTSQASCS